MNIIQPGYSQDMLCQVEPDGAPVLFIRPSILLTEPQADYLTWQEIQESIQLRLYIDGYLYPFLLEPMRLSNNIMQVTLVREGSCQGLYIPLETDRRSIQVRLEWLLNFGRFDLLPGLSTVEITHNKSIILPSPLTTSLNNPQVLAAGTSSMDLATGGRLLLSSERDHLRNRCQLTGADFDEFNGRYMITETLQASPTRVLGATA